MLFSKTAFIAAALACISALTVEAHVSLKKPCPRLAPECTDRIPINPETKKKFETDYNINTPIGTHDSKNFKLCKNVQPQTKRVTLTAGKNFKTEYNIGAAHGGGHCQWALSYDGGKKWVVVQTLIRNCLKVDKNGQYSVNVKIPANAPAGKATFMWLWNNAVGNRELYSNCAEVQIKNTKKYTSFTGLSPLIANFGEESPLIPEFPLAVSKDGKELFAARKTITIKVK